MRQTEKGKENVIMQLNFDVNDAVLQTEHLYERRVGGTDGWRRGGRGKKLLVTLQQKAFAHEISKYPYGVL